MIISRTPFRVSLFGGGSDYPAWYREHGGAVIGMAIDKYCYVTLRELPPFFPHRHRIVYSKIEQVQELAEIKHPVVRAVLTELGVAAGVELHYEGDLPARSGLGTSSAFTVGLLNSTLALGGRMVGKQALAEQAIRIEQEVIRENVGSQDQVWAAYGGLNRIAFRQDGGFEVAPLIMPRARQDALLEHLMLFFTGFSRTAHEIAGRKIANLKHRRADIGQLVAMVDEARDILADTRRPLGDVGPLLHESWLLKRSIADGVTTPAIDAIYQEALAAGATGGKLLGAGGGGFMLLFVEPARRQAVQARLSSLFLVDFAIDAAGSRIVVYDPPTKSRS